MTLKSNTFVTVAEAAKWAKLNGKVYGLVGVKATKTFGDLALTAKDLGPGGNDISFEKIAGAVAGSEVVTVVGKAITIQIEDGVSTAAQIKAKIDANVDALALVTTTIPGTGSNPQSISGLDYLALGAYSADYDQNSVDVVIELINACTDLLESIICAPALAREYTDILDGNNANVIIPTQYPIRSIEEIKIDTNRNFSSIAPLDQVNYFLRGQVDKRQIPNVSIRIVGQDIVIRDDNEKYILGRMFAGSALGSIQIIYTAGWGADAETMPSDLRLAFYLLFEFFFMQRDNRDLNIQSKGVKGESYSKVEKAIPQQVYDLLAPYTDVSLGNHPVPQRNTFNI